MATGSPSARYGARLQLIHWSIALMVIGQLALALILTQLRSLSFGQAMLALHQQLGIAILLLISARLIFSGGSQVPRPVRDLPDWQKVAAHITHRAFLVLLVAQPVLGLGVSWGRGEEISLLGLLHVPAPVEISDGAYDWMMRGHIVVAATLATLVVIHVGAVAFNGMIRNIPVLERMLPARPETELRNAIPVGWQLVMAFGVVLVVALAAGSYSIHKYRQMTTMQAALQAGDVKALDAIRIAQVSWKDSMIAAGTQETPESRERRSASAEAGKSSLQEALPLLSSTDMRHDVTAIVSDMDRNNPQVAKIDAALQSTVDSLTALVFQKRTETEDQSARGHDLIVVSMLPMVMLGFAITILLARSMVDSIARMRHLVQAVEGGRDDANITVTGAGEFSMLMRDMLSMRTTIQKRSEQTAAQHRAAELDHARVLQEARERELATRAEAQLNEQKEHLRQQELRREMQEREAAAKAEAEVRESRARQSQRQSMALELEAHMEEFIAQVMETVQELKTTASQLASLAGDSTRRSHDARNMAMQSNQSAADIARKAGGLADAATRMSGQADASCKGAVQAITEAGEAADAIHGLQSATGQISNIASVIADITRQTGLLSINARIEAARAGEAGKGFAIVATEVKELANRTRQATESIDSQLEQVSAATRISTDFIKRIAARVGELGESAGSILKCADAQRAETEEITGGLARISQSTREVVSGIEDAQGSASQTEAMSAAVLGAAQVMDQQTRLMRDQVARFVLQIQTGTTQGRADPAPAAFGSQLPQNRFEVRKNA